jgi:Na+-translocating ferredoxin:NAD+ oxidoreductase RnfG subunit|tara:strand:+ start:285 stop:476 length:192 start_codon:yes stop_codon:yes gene_type:complete
MLVAEAEEKIKAPLVMLNLEVLVAVVMALMAVMEIMVQTNLAAEEAAANKMVRLEVVMAEMEL